MPARAEYLMIGGFLGAGKTTAMLQLARRLTAQGRRVGLITNDQSHGLADTALLAAQGFAVEEIGGGCFCCRFDSLTEAVERLSQDAAPDVILAEPVGSCTDLRATVQNPLRRLYGDRYRVGPLSVLVDPLRALRIVGRESGRPFSPKVLYVYGKQLEEADLIVINKCDLLDEERVSLLEGVIRERYGGAEILRVSAREGTGLDRWLAALAEEAGFAAAPQVDYDLYAEGEALLGWLNATVRVSAAAAFDGNQFLIGLAYQIRRTLAEHGIEIAHLKMTLGTAVVNLGSSGGEPELRWQLEESLTAGTLLVNLRAECAPDLLRSAVAGALGMAGPRSEVQRLDCFRPGRPVPSLRMP